MHIRKIRNHAISAAATLAITWSAAFSAFAATVALALCVTDANAATLAPDTAHDDIPGDATLKEIVEGAGATEALEAEAKERKAADAALQTNVTATATAISDETTARENADNALQGSISAHASDTTNPHKVTAVQVGVSLADATSVTTNEAGEVVTNVVADVKRLTVDEANADLTTKKYVDAATADAGKVQSVNGKTGEVVLAASDVGVWLTNGVITIDGERIEPLTSFAESDPHVGLTNGTIYVHGATVTPLTSHQSLADYAKTTDVNAADASLFAYTTGVSNEVEAAQSAADANAAAIAAETKERLANFASASDAILENKNAIEANASAITSVKSDLSEVYNDAAQAISDASSAQAAIDKHKANKSNPHGVTAAQVGALTAESDPSTALTNGVAWVRGKKVISEHQSLDAYLKTADLASKETDPKWAAWRKGVNVSLGKGASAPDQDADTGASLTLQAAVGINSKTKASMSSAFGYNAYSFIERSVAFAVEPSGFYLNSKNTSENPGSTARTLQSYLDERATTKDLADVKAMISATDKTFSNAVLQVGIGTLGITTNDLQVVHDLAELPVGTSITTVGGLLAALAAGLAALKKKTDDIKSSVDSANAALEEVA